MRILFLIEHSLIQFFRDKIALMFAIILPVIFTTAMGFVFGNVGRQEQRIPVGIVNMDVSDKSGLTGSLLNEIKKDRTISVEIMTEDELAEQVRNVDVEAGFIFPEGFGRKIQNGETVEVKVVKIPSSVAHMAVEGIIRSALEKLILKDVMVSYFEEKLAQTGEEMSSPVIDAIKENLDKNLKGEPVLTVNTTIYSGNKTVEYDGIARSSIGSAVMFVMFTLIFSAGEILEEKKNKTWGRLLVAPVPRSQIIAGKILGTYVIGWVQILILILFGSIALGVSWGNSLTASIAVMSIYLLTITALGMLLSSLVKTNAQLGAIAAILIICTSMISGCYWPVEIMPEAMQKAATFFPQYWAIKALTGTVVANQGIGSVVVPMAVLAFMAAVFFSVTVSLAVSRERIRGIAAK